jgi:hypothetical protein
MIEGGGTERSRGALYGHPDTCGQSHPRSSQRFVALCYPVSELDKTLRAAGVALAACVRVAIERTAAREEVGFIV